MFAMLLVRVSVLGVVAAAEIDSLALLQSRSQTATTQRRELHTRTYLDAAVARKKAPEAPQPRLYNTSYSGSPTVITQRNVFGCKGLDRSIDDVQECYELSFFYNKKFGKTGSWSDRPVGCFAIQLGAPRRRGFKAGQVYFNNFIPGVFKKNSVPICKEAVCDFFECPQHYIKKITPGPDWTLNPNAEACCDGLCTEPSAPGYDLAAAGGVVKIMAFAPNGLRCADGHIGNPVASVCPSAGAAYIMSGCQAVCTTPSTTGYVFDVARGALTIDGFGLTGLSCAADYTGSARASVCLSPGGDYSVTGCEPTCIAPWWTPGYNFTTSAGVLKITGFGPTGLTCGNGYSGLVTASACPYAGTAYSVSGCEVNCKLYQCPVGHVRKGGAESITNPSDAVCCDAVCTAPSTPGYNFATSAGILKITGFGPTGLTCGNGYSGLVTAFACSSAGAAYSVTGCVSVRTCIDHSCPSGYVRRLFQDWVKNPDDSKCCKRVDAPQYCIGGDLLGRRRRHNPVEYATVACGPCVVTSNLCVTSPNWPSNYNDNERCEIHMPRTPLLVYDFETEADFETGASSWRSRDYLEVNNVDYRGTYLEVNYALNGRIANGPIEWTSDSSITKTGWEICATNTNTCILWDCSVGFTKNAGWNSRPDPSDSRCCEVL